MWVNSDPKLEMEMASAIADTSDSWSYKELTCIKNLLDKHTGSKSMDIIMEIRGIEHSL